MSQSPARRITRSVAELDGPAVRIQELVEDEGLDSVLRAIDRGLTLYDATTALLVQRPVYEVINDGRVDPKLLLREDFR